MKKIIIDLISFTTKEKTYKKTFLRFIIATLVVAFLTLLDYLISKYLISKIILSVLFIVYIYLLLAFISRIICIGENKKNEKKEIGLYKTKYEAIDFDYEIVIKWLKNKKDPETLLCYYNNKYFEIDIVFDVVGRRGNYYNKQYYLNKEKMTEEQIIDEIGNRLIDGKLRVYETFDHNGPDILVKEIEGITNNKNYGVDD